MLSWMKVSAAGVLAVGWLPALPPVCACLAGAVCALLLRPLGPRAAVLLLSALLGAAYGSWWGRELLDARLHPALENIPLPAVVRVLEPPQQRAFSRGGLRQRFAADVLLLSCPASRPDCERHIGRVLLSYYGKQTLRAAERWQVELKLKRPRGLANPGSFNYESWLARHRFAATGYIRDRELLPLDSTGGLWHQRWRQALGDSLLEQAVDQDVAGVLLALSTGDRSRLSQAAWERLQRYGLNHLVVISGLHVGLVAGIGFLIGRIGGRRCAHLSAASLALIYSALAGFALPTLRALVMLACVQVVALSRRRLRPVQGLSAALLVVSLVEPLASFGAGFWLSFGAVAFIFYLRHMQPQLATWRFTLFLQLTLAPAMGLLASFWFGGFGWLAPLANLVAVPVLTFWMAPLCLAGAVLAPFDAAGSVWELAALPVKGFLLADQRMDLPLWLAFRPDLPTLGGVLLAILALVAHRALPLRRTVALLLLAAVALRPGHTAPGGLEVWLLDVGQGLSVVLRQGDFAMVYDTGAGDPAGPNMASAVLVPFLEEAGIQRLDLLVISHGDNDHASGVHSLHAHLPIAETWFGEAAFPGIPRQQACRAGQRRRFGDVDIEVLGPPGAGAEGNNASCVLRVHNGGYRLLLPGDIETEVEYALLRNRREQLSADLLVLPHHGSRSSSSSAFLAAVAPDLVLLSRGYHNRFGHPHGVVTRRLQAFGLRACDSAEQGAIAVRASDGYLRSVVGWRHKRRYYWAGAASPPCIAAYNGAQVE